jgi:hypothetical protein
MISYILSFVPSHRGIVRQVCSCFYSLVRGRTTSISVTSDSFSVFKWFIEQGVLRSDFAEEFVKNLVGRGTEGMLKYAREIYPPVEQVYRRHIENSVVHNNLNNLKWLDGEYSLYGERYWSSLNLSVTRGTIECLSYLLGERRGNQFNYLLRLAAKHGRIEVAKFLHYKGLRRTHGKYLSTSAAKREHLEFVKFMIDKEGEYTLLEVNITRPAILKCVLEVAKSRDHQQVVDWAEEQLAKVYLEVD